MSGRADMTGRNPAAATFAPGVGAVVLFHGAGGGADHPTFLALEAALDPLPVVRAQFPYRAAGRRWPPDPQKRLLEAVVAECQRVEKSLDLARGSVVLGGRSLGGRISSIAAADGLAVAGLLLLSYPLHPPKKADKLRVDHFPKVDAPCLFVSGDRDPFGTPEEFAGQLTAIAGPVDTIWLPGANHEPVGHDHTIVESTIEWLRALEA